MVGWPLGPGQFRARGQLVAKSGWTTLGVFGHQPVWRLTLLLLCLVYNLCMPTKTVSVRIEAYEKLKRARRYERESFSEVVLRAHWPEETITAGELARLYREKGPFFNEEELARIERLKGDDQPPENKWADR